MIKTIGVIGAGQMGHGIAQVCAMGGYRVVLIDAATERLDEALAEIDASLARKAGKGKIDDGTRHQALERIETGADFALLAEVDMVIEAVTEDEQVKRAVFAQACPHLKPEAVICSNTSTISITRLGAATDRPAKFIGMHFMNPVPAMELVELIRGIATAGETYQAVKEVTEAIGKVPVMVEDFPGYIVNRVLQPMINEAIYTLYEGVGTVDAIDKAMCLGAHHRIGPLELADFIGLDVCLNIMHVLHEGLADSKYRPCPLLVKYVEAGWLGKKTGRGFYDYGGDEPVPTR